MILNILKRYQNIHYKWRMIGFISLFLLLSAVSCNFNSIFENTADIPGGIWKKDAPVIFNAEIKDTVKSYNIVLSIRNNNNYPYSNIFLLVDAVSPKGTTLRDTLEFELCDSRGKWYGKGIGGVWQNKVYYKKDIRFPNSGKYSFKIMQAMRNDNLEGIMDLGMKIENFSK